MDFSSGEVCRKIKGEPSGGMRLLCNLLNAQFMHTFSERGQVLRSDGFGPAADSGFNDLEIFDDGDTLVRTAAVDARLTQVSRFSFRSNRIFDDDFESQMP